MRPMVVACVASLLIVPSAFAQSFTTAPCSNEDGSSNHSWSSGARERACESRRTTLPLAGQLQVVGKNGGIEVVGEDRSDVALEAQVIGQASSREDAERLVRQGIRIRLCKGAYKEPSSVAFPKKTEVDANFVRLMEKLLESGAYPAIATHDPKMVQWALDFARLRETARIPGPERHSGIGYAHWSTGRTRRTHARQKSKPESYPERVCFPTVRRDQTC